MSDIYIYIKNINTSMELPMVRCFSCGGVIKYLEYERNLKSPRTLLDAVRIVQRELVIPTSRENLTREKKDIIIDMKKIEEIALPELEMDSSISNTESIVSQLRLRSGTLRELNNIIKDIKSRNPLHDALKKLTSQTNEKKLIVTDDDIYHSDLLNVYISLLRQDIRKENIELKSGMVSEEQIWDVFGKREDSIGGMLLSPRESNAIRRLDDEQKKEIIRMYKEDDLNHRDLWTVLGLPEHLWERISELVGSPRSLEDAANNLRPAPKYCCRAHLMSPVIIPNIPDFTNVLSTGLNDIRSEESVGRRVTIPELEITEARGNIISPERGEITQYVDLPVRKRLIDTKTLETIDYEL